MSILNGVFSAGYVAGVQIGGKLSNYYTIFGISIAVGVVGVLYTLLVVRESVRREPEVNKVLYY